MKPILAAGALLYRVEEGRIQFLLLQNARHGTWGFPKGHAEGGESPKVCARREIREETGMDIPHFLPGFKEVLRYHVPPGTREDGKGDYNKEVFYFLAPAPSGPLQVSREHKDQAWLCLEEAKRRLEYEDLRRLLDKASRFLGEQGVTDCHPGDMKTS